MLLVVAVRLCGGYEGVGWLSVGVSVVVVIVVVVVVVVVVTMALSS